MSLFKKYRFKIEPEISNGVCPHCEEKATFISIVNDYYRCMNCGADVEQKINGVIKYLPVGKEIFIDKEHGTQKETFIWGFQLQEKDTQKTSRTSRKKTQ